MKRFMLMALVIIGIVVLTGCTNADWENMATLGSNAHIRLYSGGQLIGEWESSGKVVTESHSDGYRFVDKKSGKLIRITGQIVIEN